MVAGDAELTEAERKAARLKKARELREKMQGAVQEGLEKVAVGGDKEKETSSNGKEPLLGEAWRKEKTEASKEKEKEKDNKVPAKRDEQKDEKKSDRKDDRRDRRDSGGKERRDRSRERDRGSGRDRRRSRSRSRSRDKKDRDRRRSRSRSKGREKDRRDDKRAKTDAKDTIKSPTTSGKKSEADDIEEQVSHPK